MKRSRSSQLSPIRPGVVWGSACAERPDLEFEGCDHDLAVVVGDRPGVLVAWRPTPDSDLARALGIGASGERRGVALAVDLLRITATTGSDPTTGTGFHAVAVNAVVVGRAPDRVAAWTRARMPLPTGPAWAAVVANGQFLRGFDLVPRGHPGDGRAEFQAYGVAAGQRREMRRRMRSGTHVPHPRIAERSVRAITIDAGRPLPIEADGVPVGVAATVTVTVEPGAFRLLV